MYINTLLVKLLFIYIYRKNTKPSGAKRKRKRYILIYRKNKTIYYYYI